MTAEPLRGIPLREYRPQDLGAPAYAALARLSDEIRADKARRLLEEQRAARGAV